MQRLTSFFVALMAVIGVAFAGHTLARQSDSVIAQRLIPVCAAPNSTTTPFLYYNPGDGQWHCSATRGHVTLGGGFTPGQAATSLASTEGGLVDVSTVTSGTTQNTLYTLNTITLPASSFNANGRALQLDAFGTTATNANAKTYQVTFGSTVVATITGNTGSAADYKVSLQCVRTGASTQQCVGSITIGTGGAATFATAAPAQTDTSAIVVSVKCENTAAAAACGSGKGLVAHFIN